MLYPGRSTLMLHSGASAARWCGSRCRTGVGDGARRAGPAARRRQARMNAAPATPLPRARRRRRAAAARAAEDAAGRRVARPRDDRRGARRPGGAGAGRRSCTAGRRVPRHPDAGHDRAGGGARDRGAARWAGEIVFVTAYDEYAIAAFEQGALDYLLKPVEPQRLAQTAQRVQARLQAQAAPRRPADDAALDAAAGQAGADRAGDGAARRRARKSRCAGSSARSARRRGSST